MEFGVGKKKIMCWGKSRELVRENEPQEGVGLGRMKKGVEYIWRDCF
jgi:hypothetical protein